MQTEINLRVRKKKTVLERLQDCMVKQRNTQMQCGCNSLCQHTWRWEPNAEHHSMYDEKGMMWR